MAKQFLSKLKSIIEDPNYVVMYNDGSDKFYILKNKIYYHDDEAKVFFQGFRGEYIDIYNITVQDFKFFGKEKEMSEILDEMR